MTHTPEEFEGTSDEELKVQVTSTSTLFSHRLLRESSSVVPPDKISAVNPKTMTVKVLYSRGKIDSKEVLVKY